MSRKLFMHAALVVIVGVVASCQGAKQGLNPLAVSNFNFSTAFGGVHVNAPLELTFTAPVDPLSITPDSIRIFTTTTTTAEPDPGAPAIGDFIVTGNIVRFLPRIPQVADLSDAGLRIGFTYTIQVPASPDVISPIRTIAGRPNVVTFIDFFTTKNSTILPAPGDIVAEPNLTSLPLFFIDEGIENGVAPCPRIDLPVADQDSPQVIFTDPQEGESGFGTITGIQAGLGTAFVRLDPITVQFSEPIGPWRIRPQDISIRNTNLGGETFDLFFFFTQDRSESKLQITVFDADSAFDQASVPQGRYVLTLQNFTDLAGNQLIESSGACEANGTFDLSFSTVSSPTLPTDMRLTFDDDDQDGHVDVGGLDTPTRDINVFPEFMPPFLGGVTIDQPGITTPSLSRVKTSANYGDTAYWTGSEVRFDNGFDPVNLVDRPIPDALRVRGGVVGAGTAILAPIAGNASGRSNQFGSQDGSVAAPGGKVDFELLGPLSAALFTGDATTGPIIYQYRRFRLEEDPAPVTGGRPTLTQLFGSVFPMIILVEEDAIIAGNVVLDGADGQFGYSGANDGSTAGLSRTVGGRGGAPGAGGGRGGDGGSIVYGTDPELLNGQTGGVPVNVLGPLDQLSEAVAGVTGMASGGGGHYDASQAEDNIPGPDTDGMGPDKDGIFIPTYNGGGGGSYVLAGTQGAKFSSATPGETDQGGGGIQYGISRNDPPIDFGDPDVLAAGGGGGGGGGSDDDNPTTGNDPNALSDATDDGGGGGGGGGGFFGLAAGGDITFGLIDLGADAGDPDDDLLMEGLIRCVGGRGGSTYFDVAGDPPVPGTDAMNPDPTAAAGTGEAGGGGGGGGIALIAGGDLTLTVGEMFVWGKAGGNAPAFEMGGRGASQQGGNGGGGIILLQDSNGMNRNMELGAPWGTNDRILFMNDPTRDFGGDDPGVADPQDYDEMTGSVFVPDNHVYGDEPRERLFGQSMIVTEFFDTLSDFTSYDEVRVLSNIDAPGFAYAGATMRTIRVFLDTTNGNNGLPDLSAELSNGNINVPPEEILLTIDPVDGMTNTGMPQSETRTIIDPDSVVQQRRYARVRIIFDLATIDTTTTPLLDSFAPLGASDLTIAPGNSQANIDTGPPGVPAVADLRVRFTP